MMGAGGKKVGTGYVPIKPDTAGFGNELKSGVEREGKGPAAEAGKALSGAMRGAFLGGVALMGKSVFEFADFDKGMREVFTLMPDISDKAMTEMEGHVKDFSAEFGVLPNETIPALYQSISAGVPPDNVFTFLEQAQMLAKGGVTELETAVDGLSSVVNAYGSDVISAAEVSDLMFTAVKGGKTTVDDLSKSLFNVTPTAAGLGVQFSDITAAIATMTAQGVPTSVTTTQLRQLLVELSKAGSKTAETFEELSGKSFRQFIADGGDLQGAIGVLNEAVGGDLKTAVADLNDETSTLHQTFVDVNGESFKDFIAGGGDVAEAIDSIALQAGLSVESVSDLFGSVEAGSAVLTLGGAGAEKFASELEAAANSAGATEVAFETMDTGLSATMDRVKAKLSVSFINLGEQLAPQIEDIASAFADMLDIFAELPGPMQKFIILGGTIVAGLIGFAGPILKAVKLFGMMGKAMTVLAANPWMLAAIVLAGIAYLIITNWEDVEAFFVAFGETIAEVWNDTYDATAGFVTDVYDAVTGTFDEIGAFFVDWWPFILGVFTGGIGLVVGLIIQNWDQIWAKTVQVWDWITGKVTGAWNAVYGTTMDVGGKVVNWIIDIPNKIGGAFTTLADTIKAPFVTAFDGIKAAWNNTVGGFGFDIPGWVPKMGGKGFTIPSMASGGVLFDPTLFLGGEYSGARSDPEIVAPQSMMRDTMLAALAEAGGRGGGPELHVHTHLHVDGTTDVATFERMLDRASTELTRVAQRELDRLTRGAGRQMAGVTR